jgi:hypothetical protein
MVRTAESASIARRDSDPNGDDLGGGPVWCFRRFGPTRTQLPDGTVLCVGGEHEDFYDPDFCIYNDLVVVTPDAGVAIYGYPEEVFPPTDFHTATLVGRRVILIGGLGYQGKRGGDETPVYELDTQSLAISRRPTKGKSPGWLFKHRARVAPDDRSILVSGGTILRGRDRDESMVPNHATFSLSLPDFRWEQVSSAPADDLDAPPKADWPEGWHPIHGRKRAYFYRQDLLNEAPPGHPLFAANVRAWAENHGGPTLFKLLDGTGRLAQLSLVEEFHRATLPDPVPTYFDTFDQWRASAMRGDAAPS